MIFDATNAYGLIDVVFDAEKMRALDYIKWVDDVTMLYCQYTLPLRVDTLIGEPATEIHQAKKIEVMLSLRMIVINPIEGMMYGNAEEEIRADSRRNASPKRPKSR